MNEELISVVITTYSRPNTLKRAISSVCNQTYKNLEIIVVDDNKDMAIRDQVIKIVEDCHDQRIRLVCNEKNLGGALSRNEGIKAARGRLISFLDDDDEYLPDRIKKQQQLFAASNDNKLALVYTYCREVGKGKKTIEYKYDFIGNCVYESMVDCIAATSQWMCRKDYLYTVGLFSDVPCKQDSTVIVKLMTAGFSIDRVPEILSIYHSDEVLRISSNNHKKRIEGEEKLRDLCRSNYSLITEKQIQDVEYAFACRLAEHYFAMQQNDNYAAAMRIVRKRFYKVSSLRVYKHLIDIRRLKND